VSSEHRPSTAFSAPRAPAPGAQRSYSTVARKVLAPAADESHDPTVTKTLAETGQSAVGYAAALSQFL